MRGRRTRWRHYEHLRRVVARRQNPPRAADRCRAVVRRPNRRRTTSVVQVRWTQWPCSGALAAPGNVRTKTAFSQNNFYAESDTDEQTGCIRSVTHAYSQDGGLAVLFGNIAEEGCIVKTAGVR